MRYFVKILGVGVAGVIASIIAVNVGSSAWILAMHGVRTTASVVKMNRDREEGMSAAPIFRFQDGNGEEHTVSSNFYRHPPAYHVGDTVRVVYERANPAHASIDSFANLWMLPIFAAGFGAVFLCASACMLLRADFVGRQKNLAPNTAN